MVFSTLKLSDLPIKSCGTLRAGSNTRPVISVIEEEGVRAIVKDFSRNKAFFRHVIGRFLVWREKRAYHRLRGIKGVPTLYRVIDGQALVLEEIPGESLENLEKRRRLPESFFRDLEALVDRFHQKGMAHSDLKRAPNTLCGRADAHPYIVDWGPPLLKKR
ncbi:MAG: serine/threonine-protein kinase [Deltaproteobacteria bacterium]|nr:serine/threonine-protein kinase [Deltaproteobacteria bacterium]